MKTKYLKALLILCLFLFIIGAIAIFFKYSSNASSNSKVFMLYQFVKENETFVIISTLLGFVGSIASIISLGASFGVIGKPIESQFRPIGKYSGNHSQFTNRINEFQYISQKIETSTLINIFGDKGVGKSELLKMYSDMINGNLSKKIGYDFTIIKKQKNKRALYFDVSDKTGATDIISELCNRTFLNMSPSIENFIQNINNNFKNYMLIIIIDNINNQGIRRDMDRIMELYRRERPNDVFIIGSISRYISFKFPVEEIEVLPFREKEIATLASRKQKKLSEEDLKNLFSFSQGLPIFLEIILNYSAEEKLSEKIAILNIKEYIFSEIINNLSDSSAEMLKCASFLNISRVELDSYLLTELGFEHVEDKIAELKRYSMIITDPKSNSFKVHDRIAEIITDFYFKQAEETNSQIASYFKNHGYYREYVLHTLVSNRLVDEFQDVINIIKVELENENLAFLISVGQLSTKFNRSNYIANKIPEVYNLILYTYLYATMGIGDYINAASIVKNTNKIPSAISSITSINNQIEFDYHFLWADLEHLQNKYSNAIQNFEILREKALELGFLELESKCVWGIAHSYRHQGKYLTRSYEFYCECEKLSRKHDQKKYLIKSLNGKICINLVWSNKQFEYEKIFNEIYKIAEKDSSLQDTIYSTKKYHSIYLRRIKHYADAKIQIIEGLEGFKRIGKRLIYNMHFELGEYYRDLEEYDSAFYNYNIACEFANKNLDKNLLTQSRLAILLTEIGADKRYYNRQCSTQIDEVLAIIEICEECDLHVNKIQSELVLLYLKDEKIQEHKNYYSKYLHSQNLMQELDIYNNLSKEAIKHMQLILL